MKFIVQIMKIAAIVLLAISAITILGTLLGLIDTTLVVAVLSQFQYVGITFQNLGNYPNVWIVVGYLLFRNIILFGIDMFKEKINAQ